MMGGVRVAAAQVSVRLDVNQEHITLEDELIITISVDGSARASDPVLPSLPAFEIVQSSQSSNIQILNGQMSFKKVFNFVAIPKEEGAHTISPVRVTVGDQEYLSNQVVVTVGTSPHANPPPTQFLNPPGNQPGPPLGGVEPTPTQPAEEERPPFWITATLSKSNPFVNEQILYTFRFFTRVPIVQASLDQPEFENLWIEEVVPEKKYEQVIDGERYIVSEKVVALFPLRSGEFEIPGTRLEVAVADQRVLNLYEDFFLGLQRGRTKTKHLKTEPIKLTVQPLPEPRPKDFAQIVGKFQLEGTLSPEQITIGDSVTLEVSLQGVGNIKDALLPETVLTAQVKSYSDEPTVELIRKDSGISGKKVFKQALVPLQTGTVDLPAVTVSYFDPELGEYVRLSQTLPKLTVTGSRPDDGPAPVQADTKITQPRSEGYDIAPIHTEGRSGDEGLDYPLTNWFGLGMLLVPPSLYFIVLMLRRRRVNAARDGGGKAHRAFTRSVRRLLREQGEEVGSLVHFNELLRTYIGTRLGTFGASLTTADIVYRLNESLISKSLVTELKQQLDSLEGAQYGGIWKNGNVRDFILQVAETVKKIDGKLK